MGHIPGAINIDWLKMLTEVEVEGGPRFFKSSHEMQLLLDKMGLGQEKEIITHCQASIRGAVGSLVLKILDYPRHRLYDAAMAEWANKTDTALEL